MLYKIVASFHFFSLLHKFTQFLLYQLHEIKEGKYALHTAKTRFSPRGVQFEGLGHSVVVGAT